VKKKHWSKTVKEECEHKIEEMMGKYINLLNKIKLEVNNRNDLLTEDKMVKIAIKSEIKIVNKESIVNEIWESENLNYEISSEELSYKIINIIKDYQNKTYSRENNCDNCLIMHNRYKEYIELKRELEKQIHYPDVEIFLDAYDLAILKEPDLEIITSDANPKDINYIKKILKINKITDLAFKVFK
jgi:hypothetical protein